MDDYMHPVKAIGVDYGRIYAFVNFFNLLRTAVTIISVWDEYMCVS